MILHAYGRVQATFTFNGLNIHVTLWAYRPKFWQVSSTVSIWEEYFVE